MATHLSAKYCAALRDFLAVGDPRALDSARDLGRRALSGPGISSGDPDLAALLADHHATLAVFPAADQPGVFRRAAEFLAAFLAPAQQRLATLVEQRRAIEGLPEVLLENVPAVIYVTGAGGKSAEFLFVGPQAETLLGIAAAEWLADARVWLDRLHSEDQARVLSEEALARASGSPFVSEYRFRARDGRLLWLHDEASAVRDAAGEVRFWRGVLFDITERKRAEQKAAAAERDRLARELHDSVTQTLMSAAMLARTIPRLWQRDLGQGQEALGELSELTHTALSEMRTLLLELRPEVLTQAPLDELLRQLVAALRSRSRAAIELSCGALPPLPPEVQIAFYRIAQEGLNNMVKHARARHTWVQLEQRAAQLSLSIRDDGQGFDPQAIPAGHLGVRFMRERAEAIGARIEVQSRPGEGTSLRLVWPAP
jgi:PAS domain S-box-containing protein